MEYKEQRLTGQTTKKKKKKSGKIPVVTEDDNACRKELKHQPHNSMNVKKFVSPYKVIFNDTKLPY